jgi:hypothetical protein
LLIKSSFLPGGSARRNEANYFVFAFFSNGVGHQQHSYPSSTTERPPAHFARAAGVRLEKGVRILEDVHGVLKGDPMLPLVRPSLHGVPLEPKHTK